LIGLGVLRELGILITAIIVAGRSGSAFTAEIGTMQINQEVDAMRTIGLDPDGGAGHSAHHRADCDADPAWIFCRYRR
jgi:hypothetical protein